MLPNEIILYLRKSRKDYEFNDEPIEKTLERHEKMLQEYALNTYGSKIPEENIFREVVSGDTIADRPKMQEVLTLIENNTIKGVLVLEIERLARGNTIDQGIIAQTFEYTNTLIITPQKIFDLNNDMDRSFFEDGLYQSRKYLLYTKKILTRGRIRSVKEGKYIGSRLPYGYDKVKLDKEKGYKLIINKEQAKIVKMIFEMYLDNVGTGNIANHLNKIGAKPQINSLWTPAMVRNILNSKIVTGKLTWGYRGQVSHIENGVIKKSNPINDKALIVDGLHEAIIDLETFEKAQNKMIKNHRPKPPEEIKSPLAGIVKCKVCGRNMIRRPYNNRKQEDTLMCPLKGCNTSVKLKMVEERILNELEKILKNYKNNYRDNIKNNIQKYVTAIQNIEQEITKDNNKLEKVFSFFEDGTYNREEFYARKKKIQSSIEDKKQYLEDIKTQLNEEKEHDYSSLIPKLESSLKIYNKSSVSIKNEILKSLIDSCYYYKDKNSKWKEEDNFSLEIVLKI